MYFHEILNDAIYTLYVPVVHGISHADELVYGLSDFTTSTDKDVL